MEKLLPIIWIVVIGCLLVTLAGYYAGMKVWLDWGFWPAFAVMIVAFMFRDIGGFFLSVVGFVGMWKGWDWPLWQAFLVAFPTIAMLALVMLSGGIATAFSRSRNQAIS